MSRTPEQLRAIFARQGASGAPLGSPSRQQMLVQMLRDGGFDVAGAAGGGGKPAGLARIKARRPLDHGFARPRTPSRPLRKER